jgi:hypothetical protein
MEQNLAAIFANAPGGDHGLTRLAGAQPLGNFECLTKPR